MALEPVARQVHHLFQSARLLEQVRGTWNDLEFDSRLHLPHGIAIHLDDRFIVAADNEQRGRLDAGKCAASQVRTAAT
jgi:hypothetical protein